MTLLCAPLLCAQLWPRSGQRSDKNGQRPVDGELSFQRSEPRRRKSSSGGSDVDSIRTEDYENQFHTTMVKHVAHVPVTTFDRLTVDSDLDTVKSQAVHHKFRTALGIFSTVCRLHFKILDLSWPKLHFIPCNTVEVNSCSSCSFVEIRIIRWLHR